MTGDECILLGTIAKTHGVKGELLLRTSNPDFDLKDNWESLFLKIDGILVPFFVASLRALRPGEWVLRLDWYEDRERAESLVGLEAWIPGKILEKNNDELYLDELVGYDFLDRRSSVTGRITDFMDISENPLYEVKIGESTLLIPAQEEFILEVDTRQKKVTLKLPDGLF